MLNEEDLLFWDIDVVDYIMDDSFMHYGQKHRSGRFPYGSGEFPYQHEPWFQGFGKAGSNQGRTLNAYVSELRAKGISDPDIAKGFGLDSVNQLRKELAIGKEEARSYSIHKAMELRDKGMGNSEIARAMSTENEKVGESTVRAWLKAGDDFNNSTNTLYNISEMVRNNVDSKGLIDIGPGVAETIGISRDRLEKAVNVLQNEGYQVYNLQVNQLGTEKGMKTTIKVIAPADMTIKDAYANIENLHNIIDYTIDGGKTILGIPPVNSVDSKRIAVEYASPKDGCIELRRGVKDLDLGEAQYAQVRIGVDGTHYIKGMARYTDDLPDGIDIRVCTNKKEGTPLANPDPDGKSVLKPMKRDGITGEIDQDNPFGASIKSEIELKRVGRFYTDENGEQKVSAINVVNEPGDWANWSKTLPSQFLAKQDLGVIKRQLNQTFSEKQDEFKEIMNLTNPVLKAQLLDEFAESCDSAAVHLKASAFPKQQVHAILPLTDINEDECFAPNYENGTKIACVRYPHAGPYEIPILTVNNNVESGKKYIGTDAPDAIGINPKQAGKLSGADFDGDTCTVFPLGNGVSVRAMDTLKGLAGFEPKDVYKGYEGMKVLKNTGGEMGKITNLLTDMWATIDGRIDTETAAAKAKGIRNPKIGLTDEELDDLVRATKHSMVIVDAEKHKLDYKRSYEENGIKELQMKYRPSVDGKPAGSASSLFSRAKSPVYIEGVRTRAYKDDPETGEKKFNIKEEKYTDKAGNEKTKSTKSTQMYETDDAYDLMSGPVDPKTGRKTGTPKEVAYADYANNCKALANEARREASRVESYKRDPAAAKLYEKEVASLNDKYLAAVKNSPKERTAQVIANAVVKRKTAWMRDIDDYEAAGYDKSDIAKYKQKITGQALNASRTAIGAEKPVIRFTNNEWECIQNRGISSTRFTQLLKYADKDQVRALATPRQSYNISDSVRSRVSSMVSNGATLSEITRATGAPSSYVREILNNRE